MTYRFRVGVCDLGSSFGQWGAQKLLDARNKASGHHPEVVSHACFLLNTDLFEYSQNGAERHLNVGRDTRFDWERLGSKLNGTTHVSPDELWGAICRGHWNGKDYHVVKHNCHAFVRFCLDAVGAGFFYQDYDQIVNSLY
jgi:hypothetical protein